MLNRGKFDEQVSDALIGMIAGVVATGPMTVAMILLHRRLPSQERYPLPPREITEKLTVTPANTVREPAATAFTLAAHFAYGAGAGMLYSLARKKCACTKMGRAHGAVWTGDVGIGTLFGMMVWVVSYLGLLPATGLLSPATKHPARRNLLMAGAHLLWGATLGGLTKLFTDETQASSRAFRRNG